MSIRIIAWPAVSANPYVADLYGRIQHHDPTITVENFKPLRSWLHKADLIHVHWPEAAVGSPSHLHALGKATVVLVTLWLHKLRRGRIVWTCHNLQSHDTTHPRMEAVFRRLFEPLVDGAIHLSQESRNLLAQQRRLIDIPSQVVPHGQFGLQGFTPPNRQTARARLGIEDDLPVLTFVGMIRPYKNVPELLRAFAELDTPAHLIVAGRPMNEDLRRQIRAAAVDVDRVQLDDRWLTDEEIATRVRASDAVVLPYRDVNNSGVAILVAGLGRPVAVNPSGSLADFGASVGEDWVYHLPDRLSGQTLQDILDWAARDRFDTPSLSDFDADLAATRTIDFLRRTTPGTS